MLYLFPALNLIAIVFASQFKRKVFDVNVLISPEYLKTYNDSHNEPLGSSLLGIANALETSFNNSTRAKSNGYRISFNINTSLDNPLLVKMTPEICEGSTNNITNLLNDINNYDNTHHFVVFLPCLPSRYTEIFNSIESDVPIIDQAINIECSKRIAVLYEANYHQLFSSFSNALLKIIQAPSGDLATITQSEYGDEGLKAAVTINDDTVYNILSNRCFLNTSG